MRYKVKQLQLFFQYYLINFRNYSKVLDNKGIFLYNSTHKLVSVTTKLFDLLAQPVEHLPFKEVAVGSNPTRVTISMLKLFFGRLAQLVERYPYKVDVISSSLISTTMWSHHLMVRILDFHSNHRGSNPLGITI
jgi:hypothetical protein